MELYGWVMLNLYIENEYKGTFRSSIIDIDPSSPCFKPLRSLITKSYSEKLTEIFKNNNIKSITVTRMTVPCCGGLQYAVEKAVADSGKTIPVRVVTIGTDGNRVN